MWQTDPQKLNTNSSTHLNYVAIFSINIITAAVAAAAAADAAIHAAAIHVVVAAIHAETC